MGQKKKEKETQDPLVAAQYYVSRYFRPESLDALVQNTKFNANELKLLYRGFKQSCPLGTVSRAEFQEMFACIFPHGTVRSSHGSSDYADFVFNTFDEDNNGLINFDEFVKGLSIISRGTPEEKVTWIFHLYDLDNSNQLTMSALERMVEAVYNLLGYHVHPPFDETTINLHAKEIWKKMDENDDGYITKEEFLHTCLSDPNIGEALELFNTKL